MKADLIVVGGGLAGSLLALRLARRRPAPRVLLLERGPTLGGNHTWSYHGSDLTPEQHDWLETLRVHHWSGHEVRFPRLQRRLDGDYRTITAERLHRHLMASGVATIRLNTAVTELAPRYVVLADGSVLEAEAVLDARGELPAERLALGYQKFVGLEVTLTAPHGLEHPILMDATVSQEDGYRFLYTLPLGADRLLVEDTRYSDGATLDTEALARAVQDYAAGQGWSIHAVERTETGVLPIVLAGERPAPTSEAAVPRIGLGAGLFHPTTGYSLPDAVRTAEAVAAAEQLDAASLRRVLDQLVASHWRRTGFFRLLNRMLFGAATPGRRYRVLERFYRLPEPLIARFYAGRPTLVDRLRVLAGRPPVPLLRALSCLSGRPFLKHQRPTAKENPRNE
ncbi:MAG: lycopene beta-cyclase CrtY [Pseudomonadota bacterium]